MDYGVDLHKMKIPGEFLKKMESLLGQEEFERFVKSFSQPRAFGLRVNTLKVDVEEFLRLSPFRLESVPWTKDGFYFEEGESPGKHPYYHAGLYYIQEPSAMLPGEVIGAKPGERILDVCAAPGGKTVQIAARMQGRGILVSNDVNAERVRTLVKNIELLGVRNAIVTNETPENLSRNFAGYFDRILVDAPCSGEGMFRKDPEAVKSWENYKCEKCACMQWDILKNLDAMLRPGGVIVYSTCTFAPEENEQMIAKFLDEYPGYDIVEIPKTGGISDGRPEWGGGRKDLAKTARLWPHKLRGEGHFTAVLKKRGGCSSCKSSDDDYDSNVSKRDLCNIYVGKGRKADKHKNRGGKSVAENESRRWREALEALRRFEEEHLNISIDGIFYLAGPHLYCLPEEPPSLDGLKVAKFGWYLGEIKKGELVPSHSLVVSLKKKDLKRVLDLDSGSQAVERYLRGETIEAEGRGLTAVCVDGFTLGWGKAAGGMLKNLYPKGWRRLS